MKICHLFADPFLAGSEHQALLIAEAARGAGHKICFVLGKNGPLTDELTKREISYETIRMQSSFNPIEVFGSVLKLKKFIKRENVEILHTHMLREHSIAIAAKFLGAKAKVVRTIHRQDQYDFKMRPLLWFYNWQTDSFVAITEQLKKEVSWVKKEKVTVIENGVPEIAVSKYAAAAGYLGRLEKEKGVYELLKEGDIQSPFVIGGEGPEKELITSLNQKNIEMLGYVSDRRKFFEKINLFVLPSETEVLPLTVLESFSAGVPVVAFDIPALKELITPDVGVLIPAGDNKTMAKEIEELLNDKKKLQVLSEGAKRKYRQKYTVEAMWEKTESLYKSLLS